VAVDVPDDALIVRGGDPHDPERLQDMIDRAQLAYDRGFGYALSTYAGFDSTLTRDELLRQVASCQPIPNRKLAATTAAQLRGINCELIANGLLPCHVRVILGTEPDPQYVRNFVEVFGQAEKNPAYQETRRG
jgi:hypothetical protein